MDCTKLTRLQELEAALVLPHRWQLKTLVAAAEAPANAPAPVAFGALQASPGGTVQTHANTTNETLY